MEKTQVKRKIQHLILTLVKKLQVLKVTLERKAMLNINSKTNIKREPSSVISNTVLYIYHPVPVCCLLGLSVKRLVSIVKFMLFKA